MTMPVYEMNLQSIDVNEYFAKEGIFQLLSQICNGIQVLHNDNVIHGNLKPSNILFNKDNIYCLSDYCENMLYIKGKKEMSLSPNNISYLSPEQIKLEEPCRENDMWSLGCLIYYIFSGKHAFTGNSSDDIANYIVSCKYPRDMGNEDIFDKLITVQKENRFTITKFIEQIPRLAKTFSVHHTYVPIEKRIIFYL